jgi:hypothetical protein
MNDLYSKRERERERYGRYHTLAVGPVQEADEVGEAAARLGAAFDPLLFAALRVELRDERRQRRGPVHGGLRGLLLLKKKRSALREVQTSRREYSVFFFFK